MLRLASVSRSGAKVVVLRHKSTEVQGALGSAGSGVLAQRRKGAIGAEGQGRPGTVMHSRSRSMSLQRAAARAQRHVGAVVRRY